MKVQVKITDIDQEKQKVSLSIKAILEQKTSNAAESSDKKEAVDGGAELPTVQEPEETN